MTTHARSMRTLIGAVGAALALVATACGSGDGTAVPSITAAPATTTSAAPVGPAPTSAAPAATAATSPVSQGTANPAPVQPAPVRPAPVQPAQVVPCVDPSSPMVRDAVASLGLDQWGGVYAIDDHTPGTSADGCPELEWARATATGSGHVTVTSHVLFFHNSGRYLGTATLEPRSYTSVVAWSDTSVQVQYRWLGPDDAFCCPSNTSTVRFHWDGSSVVPSGQFPPEQ